jgi:anti-sigma factor RsiW
MKCPDDGKIQAYIDGELTASEVSAMVSHLSSCSSCFEQVEKQRKLSRDFKRIMAINPGSQSQIPPFKAKAIKIYSSKVLMWELIAACAILVLILVGPKFLTGKQLQNYPLIQGSALDIDANKPVTDQGTVLIYIDDNGTVKEYVD